MNRAVRKFLAAVLLAITSMAPAAKPSNVFLEELTWTELRAEIAAGATTIIVPIGGVEQSGPHIALGKHNARVKALSEKIARALGNALVAPVVAYVPEGSVEPPTAHMRFPGTITVPDATFEKVLESAARSFKLHGFRHIVFLGDHGDYQKDEKAVAVRLNREWAASPVRVHAVVEYYRATTGPYVDALKARGLHDDEIGTHAGLADTSLTLALAPAMVRTEQLQAAAKPGVDDGVKGDPRRSSAELGQLGVDLIVRETVAAIRKTVAEDARP